MKRNLLLIILPLLMLTTSCIRESMDGTATVTIQVSTGGSPSGTSPSTRIDDGTFAPSTSEDKISCLRVIVRHDGSVIRNRYWSFSGSESEVQTVTLEDIPVGESEFVFLANENQIGGVYSGDGVDAPLVRGNGLHGTGDDIVLVDSEGKYVPSHNPRYIPMSGKEKVFVHSDMDDISASLVHDYVKINITIENSAKPLLLKQVLLGAFFTRAMYVFPDAGREYPFYGDSDLGVPKPYYYDKDIDVNEQLDSFHSKNIVMYCFPTDAGNGITTDANPFKIGIIWKYSNNERRDYLNFTDIDGKMVQTLEANTQLNILVKINSKSNVSLLVEVLPWKQEEIDVPSFN